MQIVVAGKFSENELVAIDKTIHALDSLLNEMENHSCEEIVTENQFTFSASYIDEIACALTRLGRNDIELL